MIVVDANVVVYLLIPGARTVDAEALLQSDSAWRLPRLWRSEVRSALRAHNLRGDFSLSHAIAVMTAAEELLAPVEKDVVSATVLALAARSRVSAYDCEYVALAMELGVPLVSADRRLVAAFPDVARLL